MRRLTTTFVLVITCLCLFPQRADAYFWEWLDSLSGPKFRGFTVEWRAVCFTDGLRNRLLTETSDELSQAKLALEGPATAGVRVQDADRALFVRRVEAATKASYYAKLAAGPPEPSPDLAFKLVTAAVAWERVAQALAAQAVSGKDAALHVANFEEKATTAENQISADALKEFASPIPFGVIVSACPVNTVDRRRGSLNLNVAWGTDTKNDNNKMVMVGPSFSLRVYDWLDVGVAGGVAWFSSVEYRGFTKFYVEPAIVDLRAGALIAKLGNRQGSGWYVPVLRYTMLTFPGGFARNSFANGEAYGAEIVHQLGLHIDLEPLFHGGGRLR